MSLPGHVRLSHAHKRLLVAVLIQCEEVYLEFRSQLSTNGFEEPIYQLVMQLVNESYLSDHVLPSELLLSTAIQAYVEENPEEFSDEELDELAELIAYAFDPATFGETPPCSQAMIRFAFKAAASHLQYVNLQNVQRQMSSVLDYTELQGIYRQAQLVSEQISLSQQKSKPNFVFEENWAKVDHGKIVSTGLPFLDAFMNGGAKPGEAYVLLAPYGSCKTTLAVMLVNEAAKQSYAELLASAMSETGETDTRKELSFFFTYEAPKHECQHRLISTAAQVSRYRLEQMSASRNGLDFFSNDALHPLPYEQKRFATQIAGGHFVPERERINEVIPYLNEHFVCIDLSGTDLEHPGAGTGGVEEIARRMRQEMRNRGGEHLYKVRAVVIDYLGIAMDRDTTPSLGGKKRPDDSKLYQEGVQRINTEIAKKFKCYTFVMHQLAGEANKQTRTGIKSYDHTNAKGSKSVAENADFAFVIGSPNGNNMCAIHCTKRRRERPIEPRIIAIEGEFNTVVQPVGFRLDKHYRIIDDATAASVGVAQVSTAEHLSAAAGESGDVVDDFDDDEGNADATDSEDQEEAESYAGDESVDF